MKMIKLERPLVSIDVETHSLVEPRIVEIGLRVDYPDGREPKEWCQLINPGVPIEAGAMGVHGIKDEDVADKPQFSHWAKNLAVGLSNCDFCGQNVRFDLGVITAEMKRAGVAWSYEGAKILDTGRLKQIVQPRRLADLVREYLGREPSDAHRALGDAKDALEVAMAMIEKYPEILPADIGKLHDLCFPRAENWVDSTGKIILVDGKPALGFGKHKGRLLSAIDKGYLEWICKNDFPSDTKQIIQEAIGGGPKLPDTESLF